MTDFQQQVQRALGAAYVIERNHTLHDILATKFKLGQMDGLRAKIEDARSALQ